MLFMTVFKSRMYNSTQIATCSQQRAKLAVAACQIARCPRVPALLGLGSCELLCYVAGSSSIIMATLLHSAISHTVLSVNNRPQHQSCQ